MAAAAESAGPRSGNVTVWSRRHAPAPSVAAASQARSSSSDQKEPTIHTTTATLKNTWARRMAQTVPSSPVGSTARSAVATTTVGRTNGTRTSASASRRPGKAKRESAQVSGSAAASVRAVEASACQRVNHATSTVERRTRTSKGRSRRPSATRLRSKTAASGQAKKTARKPSGTAAAAQRPRRAPVGAGPVRPARAGRRPRAVGLRNLSRTGRRGTS